MKVTHHGRHPSHLTLHLFRLVVFLQPGCLTVSILLTKEELNQFSTALTFVSENGSPDLKQTDGWFMAACQFTLSAHATTSFIVMSK